MIPVDLDKQITDTFSVVSLLLAVAAAYLAAIWPIVNDLLGDPKVSDNYETEALSRKRTSYAAATAVLTIFEVSVAGILAPLAFKIIERWEGDGPFNPLRAGLLLAEVALLAGVLVGGTLATRLWLRR